MHSVFSAALKPDRGNNFVREHEGDFDAQMAHKQLNGFCTASVGARVSASEMLSYKTSAKFDSWKVTTESFMLKW